MSVKKRFNNNWYFSKHPLESTLNAVIDPSIVWLPVTLPHDWLIYDTTQLYESGEGWYRKTFTLTDLSEQTRYSLRFEGVYMNSTLYVNGHIAGHWKYGYSTFEFDISSYLVEGENTIYVRVVHEAPNSRWYSGAGIYRSVWLNTFGEQHIVPDGIYITTTPDDDDQWTVHIDTEIHIQPDNIIPNLRLRHTIFNADQAIVKQQEYKAHDLHTPTMHVPAQLILDHPRLWDTQDPYLYTLKSELLQGDNVVDEEYQTFGFRTFRLDPQHGLFLNNRSLKINGVCQHHDLGCLGAAVNKAALRRQMQLLQAMGVNGIRTAHNMPAVELMELADEMGILIVSEAFDMWERKKTTYDYARFFSEWWRKDIASWVRRDRNRPSLLMWSIGNEIYDTHADERGQELTLALQQEVLLHDPRQNGLVTIGSNYMPWENAQKCADIVKVAGYNYAEKYYDAHHQQHPDWIIYGSETCSTVQSRGIYHFPLNQSILADDDQQCSSLGNSSTSWGAKSTEACIIADRDAPYSLGQFLWTGFDYIGEPTPYFTKNSYFGQLDTAGFAKDSYYLYQAEWTDYRIRPMVHIFPYWDFSEGQLIDVRVCSNAPMIELFFDDVSQGIFHIDHQHGQQLVGEWQLPYTAGDLQARAYNEHGQIIAEDQKSSFGDAIAIQLTPDKQELSADGIDLIFVTVTTMDYNNRIVENANNRIHFTIEGPGRLVGLDNGDSTDYDAYKGSDRRLFSGKLLAVIASTHESGIITLRASSPTLQSQQIMLDAVASDSGQSVYTNIQEERYLYADYPLEAHHKTSWIATTEASDIPIRKLEIICPQGHTLTPDRPKLPIQVKCYPDQASYQDIQWRITNAKGIDSNITVIESAGHQAWVSAIGDGEVYIRCATTNGAESIRLYSQMQITLSGFGESCLDPYEFVSAGYHSSNSRNLTNGNERGVATAREGESYICFERIDFGQYGADEITLPIFSLDDEPFIIEVWEGIPHNDHAVQIAILDYQKPSRWNVYQEQTYTLSRRLTGIVSLTFVLHRKIHLKGFQFTPKLKAYERLYALEYNEIYGDSFTITPTAIEHIGNNVSLIFDEMDFGEQGSSRIVISGRSTQDNTLHLRFSGEQGESQQLIEYTRSATYSEQEFVFAPITGKQTVTFLFLPGSEFDFEYFQFYRHV